MVITRVVQAPAASRQLTRLPLTHGIIFRQLFDAISSTYTYLLACPDTLQAALIDPVLEQAERDLEVVDDLGLSLTHLLNTHCHADHITGTGKIKALRPGARSCISAASGAAADLQLQPDQALTLGSLRISCLATPGHTNGCMSFYLPPAAAAGQPGVVFSGDALLIRSCGRTDFQQGDAALLYDNIHNKIFSLPDDTLIYPGHDYKGRTVSSVAEEKTLNTRLTKPKEQFVQLMADLNLPLPKQIQRSLPANLKDGVDFPYA
uniref:persulfide dioxygenase n=1 Tax=Tetradesmus obliquus TaxID=3088 RepID=A0A383W3C2_TETOB|eukprot:jgi/Sobl393_1/12645/SZX71612.1